MAGECSRLELKSAISRGNKRAIIGYVMDRDYMDFTRLFRFTQAGVFFVTRAKGGMKSWRHRSRTVEPNQGVRSDQLIRLAGAWSARKYPALRRRITILRIRNLPALCLPDQSSGLTRAGHHRALQESLASRTALQMGEGQSPNSQLLWDIGKGDADSKLDRRVCLRVDCDREQVTPSAAKSLHNSANSERGRI